MNNLFDYAYKELAQDSFILWLANCYIENDDEVSNFSNHFLKSLVGIKEGGKVSNLKTSAQVTKQRLDILVEFDFKGNKFLLCIEDKVYSSFHDEQLERIFGEFSTEKYLANSKVYIYYKTGYVAKFERDGINDINNKNGCDWKIFDIDKILDIFSGFLVQNCIKCYKNLYIQQYYEHIKALKEKYDNVCEDMQISELKENDIRWLVLFDKFLEIKKENIYLSEEFKHYNNQYFYAYFRNKKDKNRDFFAIEFRSKINKNGLVFCGRFVVYDMEQDKLNKNKINQFIGLCNKYNEEERNVYKIKINNRKDTERRKQKEIGSVLIGGIKTFKDYIFAAEQTAEIYLKLYNQFCK